MKKRKVPKFYNFSFGVTSAIMTSLAVVIGLSGATSNITIITALLIIAIADNISDSFGIHIYQESKHINPKEVKTTTASNFIARMLITFVFILFVVFMPINLAIIFSIIFGIAILIILSYLISKSQETSPYRSIIRHLTLAIILMVASFILKYIILKIGPGFSL
jgi:VIT1/CCC1 family predicted Fe2+/Mn2+ transporter